MATTTKLTAALETLVASGALHFNDAIAISCAVQACADNMPEGFGTFWHSLCVSLTQDTANDAMAIMRSIE